MIYVYHDGVSGGTVVYLNISLLTLLPESPVDFRKVRRSSQEILPDFSKRPGQCTCMYIVLLVIVSYLKRMQTKKEK